MTQENKELLIKDLCMRMPYGVKVKFRVNEVIAIEENITYVIDGEYSYITDGKSYLTLDIIKALFKNWLDEIKPYLFPLSSMTEEQKEKALSLLRNCDYYLIDGVIKWLDNCPIEFFDWCNKHHFDYRGLIEKGLAIDATELNIY